MTKSYGLAPPNVGPWDYASMVEDVERVLIVVAHPDDADHGAGGTIARMVRDGLAVHEVILTQGGAGGHDPTQTSDDLKEVRLKESRAAAEVLGCSCDVLDHPDGMLFDSEQLRRDVARAVRAHRPELVMTMTPVPLVGGVFINHPDHRVAAQVLLDCLVTGGPTALIFPELLDEGLQPHKPSRIALFGPIGGGAMERNVYGDIPANCVVDITSTLAVKRAALGAHESQMTDRDLDDFVRWISAAAASREDFEFGETFHVLEVFP